MSASESGAGVEFVRADMVSAGSATSGACGGARHGAENGVDASTIDWNGLQEAAQHACTRSYSPYSRFPVGAAALTADGRVVTGANIENASYGVTLCAECSLVSALIMDGGGKLAAFICVDGTGQTLMPCGRCRQLLYEHAAAGMLLQTVSGIRTIDEVLPDAFGPHDLDDYREAGTAASSVRCDVPRGSGSGSGSDGEGGGGRHSSRTAVDSGADGGGEEDQHG